MSLFGIFVIFLISWWVVLFAVLPTGVRSHHESQTDLIEGQDPGAPVDSQMWRKVKLTTLIAAGITAAVFAIVHFEIISLEQFSAFSPT